jgi:hypothetical protein
VSTNHPVNRRQWLGAAALASASPALLPTTASATPPSQSPPQNPIPAENDRPGTRDWLNAHVHVDPKTRYRSPRIEGYASHTSIPAGQTLNLFISANPPKPVSIKIYRLGYYQGLGARLVTSLDPVRAQTQPDPAIGPKRLRECQWSPTAEIKIPTDWLSGVYLAQLSTLDDNPPAQSYITFIITDNRQADFLFQCSDTTWNAYNR